jgi:hypothetical protein
LRTATKGAQSQCGAFGHNFGSCSLDASGVFGAVLHRFVASCTVHDLHVTAEPMSRAPCNPLLVLSAMEIFQLVQTLAKKDM